MTSAISSTLSGKTALWKSFWLLGILGTIVLSYFLQWTLDTTIKTAPKIYPIVTVSGIVFTFCYTAFVIVAIWQSASSYHGPKVFALGAKLAVIIYLLFLAYSIYQLVTMDFNDPDKSSENISQHLKSDPKYPLIGFWKSNCNDNFGIAIDKADEGEYSLSFCGPGGCFNPGTYRPNSPIYGDTDYKVVDDRTLRLMGRDGFLTYYRCAE